MISHVSTSLTALIKLSPNLTLPMGAAGRRRAMPLGGEALRRATEHRRSNEVAGWRSSCWPGDGEAAGRRTGGAAVGWATEHQRSSSEAAGWRTRGRPAGRPTAEGKQRGGGYAQLQWPATSLPCRCQRASSLAGGSKPPSYSI